MIWDCEWAPKEKETAALIKRGITPSWVKDQPKLPDFLMIYYDALLELSTTRQIGMSAGPIPWDKIVQYAERLGYRGETVDEFVYIIMRADSILQAHISKKTADK